MSHSLGEREVDVMAVLWRGKPSTVAEVREAIPAPLAYNTVLTILRNLEAKGFVKHQAEGRVFRYSPAITEAAVRGSAVTRLVRKFFGGSPLGMVTHLVENEGLSAAEIKNLQNFIDEYADKASKKPRRGKP